MNELALIPSSVDSVSQQWRRSTDAAGLVKEAVLKCTISIQGKKYLTVAGYQAVANAFGCVASSRDVSRIEGGFQAVGEVRRMTDGVVIATGVGFLGDDEKVWASRPMFAKMAMAQTRGCGRALRAAFAFMAPLIDSGLETTPAEEMEGAISHEAKPATTVTGVAATKAALNVVRAAHPKASPPRQPPSEQEVPFSFAGEVATANESHDSAPRVHPAIIFRYGKSKGLSSYDVPVKDLEYYLAGAQKSADDPEKAQWREKALAEVDALRAEIDWRNPA